MNELILALALTTCPQYPPLPHYYPGSQSWGQTTDYSVILAAHFWESKPDATTQKAWAYDRAERECMENEIRLLKKKIAELEKK